MTLESRVRRVKPRDMEAMCISVSKPRVAVPSPSDPWHKA